MRVLIAALVVLLAGAVGYVAWLNGDIVTVRLGPGRSLDAPLAAALLAAFGVGAAIVGVLTLLGALRRAWAGFVERRRLRRAARRAAETTRARDLAWSGAPDQARATILRTERGTPAERDRAEIVAETYLDEGNLAGAQELLERALDQHPGDVRLLDLLATVAERRDDPVRAIEALERARRTDPDSPRLTRRLRDLTASLGRWTEALALQDEVIVRLKSPDALAAEEALRRGLRFEVARRDDDPERSAKRLATLAREHPDFEPAWVDSGDRFLAAGKPAKARKVWERGAHHRPVDVLLDRLDSLDASEGAAAHTTQRYRALLRRHGGDATLRQRLVRHLLSRGEVDDASRELEALDPTAGPTALLRGEILRQRGDFELAASTLSRAVGPAFGLSSTRRCAACGAHADTWRARCAVCRAWGTLGGASTS